jgi:hypothetical protein
MLMGPLLLAGAALAEKPPGAKASSTGRQNQSRIKEAAPIKERLP